MNINEEIDFAEMPKVDFRKELLQIQGIKNDENKLRYSLIPPEALESLAKVLTFGANKYRKDNWKYVENANERYIDALYRHLEDWRRGERTDRESGLSHLDHAFACLAFLIYFEKKGDDHE